MASHLIAFRCPEELLQRVDQLAFSMNISRTALFLAAARMFAERIEATHGHPIPPYQDKDLLRKLRFSKRG